MVALQALLVAMLVAQMVVLQEQPVVLMAAWVAEDPAAISQDNERTER